MCDQVLSVKNLLKNVSFDYFKLKLKKWLKRQFYYFHFISLIFFDEGIMPHVDGSLFYPTVSTISLGSHTLLDFYEPFKDLEEGHEENSFEKRYFFSLLLEPCSLLILKDKMYDVYLHGIKETAEDCIDSSTILNFENLEQKEKYLNSMLVKRGTRVSLTIRNVSKIIKINKNLFFSNKK